MSYTILSVSDEPTGTQFLLGVGTRGPAVDDGGWVGGLVGHDGGQGGTCYGRKGA